MPEERLVGGAAVERLGENGAEEQGPNQDLVNIRKKLKAGNEMVNLKRSYKGNNILWW